jgi:hypothetical protein
MKALFASALLAVVAPCGALLSHGSPDDVLRRLSDLDAIDLPPARGDAYGVDVLRGWLFAYGQPRDKTERLLAVARRDTGFPLSFVVHGHDRDEGGFFVEGGNQICPVIFGAPRANKRCLVLDLEERYSGVQQLREGVEIQRVH